MIQEEYCAVLEDVAYLAACAVSGVTPARERTADMELSRVFEAAGDHMLASAAGMALASAGIRETQFVRAVEKARAITAVMDANREAVLSRLEDAGIWYMPLKGVVIKDLYPRYGMRQMADNDILIDAERAEEAKSIMEALGFTTDSFGELHHDVYFKQPVCNFELHHTLFDPFSGEKLCRYYRDVKSRLIKDPENKCGYHFTPEDFYIFMCAHEYKHFAGDGTGLRSFLDVYVYLEKFGDALDMHYVETETEKLGIADFEKQSRSLAMHLFGGQALTAEDEELFRYVARSGTYGDITNAVEYKVKQMGGGKRGKIKYALSRFNLPMDTVQSAFPFLYRHRFLLPFFNLYRMVRGLLLHWPKVRRELGALFRMKPEGE